MDTCRKPEKQTGHAQKGRRNHSAAFEAEVALDAIRSDGTLDYLAKLHAVHRTRSRTGRPSCSDANVFGAETAEPVVDLKDLHAKLGRQ